MATWEPFANGFEGIDHERKNRTYIRWSGFVDGEERTKRFRVNETTRKRIIQELQV